MSPGERFIEALEAAPPELVNEIGGMGLHYVTMMAADGDPQFQDSAMRDAFVRGFLSGGLVVSAASQLADEKRRAKAYVKATEETSAN